MKSNVVYESLQGAGHRSCPVAGQIQEYMQEREQV